MGQGVTLPRSSSVCLQSQSQKKAPQCLWAGFTLSVSPSGRSMGASITLPPAGVKQCSVAHELSAPCTGKWPMWHTRLTVSGLSQCHFSLQHRTPVTTPGRCHHQDGPLHYNPPWALPRYLSVIQIHGPKSRLRIDTVGDPDSPWVSPPHPYLTFFRGQLLCDGCCCSC